MNRIIIGSVFLIFLLSACRITNTIHPHFKGCWKIYIVNSDNAEREYGVLKFISESEAQVFQLHKEYHIRSRNIRIDGDSLFFLFENQPFRGAISPDKLTIVSKLGGRFSGSARLLISSMRTKLAEA